MIWLRSCCARVRSRARTHRPTTPCRCLANRSSPTASSTRNPVRRGTDGRDRAHPGPAAPASNFCILDPRESRARRLAPTRYCRRWAYEMSKQDPKLYRPPSFSSARPSSGATSDRTRCVLFFCSARVWRLGNEMVPIDTWTGRNPGRRARGASLAGRCSSCLSPTARVYFRWWADLERVDARTRPVAHFVRLELRSMHRRTFDAGVALRLLAALTLARAPWVLSICVILHDFAVGTIGHHRICQDAEPMASRSRWPPPVSAATTCAAHWARARPRLPNSADGPTHQKHDRPAPESPSPQAPGASAAREHPCPSSRRPMRGPTSRARFAVAKTSAASLLHHLRQLLGDPDDGGAEPASDD